MDDIDIGVDTIIQARHMLRDIDLILQTRQVRLNSGKTKILTKAEAKLHFCVKENYILDLASKRIDRKIDKKLNVDVEKKFIESIFSRIYESGRFDIGAGEKILKRTLSLARKVNAKLNYKEIRHILISRPSCREAALTYLISQPLSQKGMKTLSSFIKNKSLVDDVAILNGIEALVEAKVRRNAVTDQFIIILSDYLYKRMSTIDVYALIWLISKYGNSSTIINYLRLTFDIWRADPLLGRLVGGMAPILRLDGRLCDLEKLLNNAKNPDAYEVFSFHDSVYLDAKRVGSIKPIISAPNASKPLGITHAKFLVLLSAIQNKNLNAKQKFSLLKNFKPMLKDKYYRHKIVKSLPPNTRSSIF